MTHLQSIKLARPPALVCGCGMRGARVVPAMKDGKLDGFQLYAIRPASPRAALGLENGDTAVAVNDVPLIMGGRAAETWTTVKTARAFRLEILRRGRPATLSHGVR